MISDIAEAARSPNADWQARLAALDPSRSFIVQAPAGSGKTELLIQRYLVLLSSVAQPEEIAAITFTRKAAAEMRHRVLEALAAAGSGEPPAEPHRALTWRHARAALARDRSLGWRLEQNAERLRIQTIDALCASLTRQMPVLASFGAQPESVEDARPLYREAARATLTALEARGGHAEDLSKLLAHLDGNVAVAEELLAGMLQKRDHWLRNLGGAKDRESLEAALAAARRDAVGRVRALLPGEPAPELASLGGQDIGGWQGIAEQLLTKKGEWRKKSELAQSLAGNEELREALLALTKLPPARYTDAQWEVLGAIARLLPLAVAELKLVFASRGKADFVEIAQGALTALGEPDAPTDLLLSLDYRIRHILVDEFQDTSFTQFELLEKLTAGWQHEDGRTLFLVGDPMQSIYRFREAEVGLFLKARGEGIGQAALDSLKLSANFRSQAGIVDWVNRAFLQVMPRTEDIAAGAVPYSPCSPVHPEEEGAVCVHAFFNGDAKAEAEQTAMLVEAAQAELPEGTVAVLVRNRSHLQDIVPRLKERGLGFRAIEIEPLGGRQVVQDLLALSRALAHPADRLAWLALLRAPWCGLTLVDLHALAGVDAREELPEEPGSKGISTESPGDATIWELLNDGSRLSRLSADGRTRIGRVREILTYAIENRLRGSLRVRVEATWLALAGPACVENETDLEDAEIFLDYLESSEEAGDLADLAAFEEGLAGLYALPDLKADPKSSVQIMTIHKAKGLEFDTVILPGLGRAPHRRDPSLFLWMDRPGEEGSSLLLAPIKETGAEADATYDYLLRLEGEKESHEEGRLLYVAATRARKHLHLLGDTRLAVNGGVELKPPSSGSLLARLWSAVESDFAEAARRIPARLEEESARTGEERAVIDQDLRRLPSGWVYPELPSAASWSAPEEPARAQDEIEFSWAGETARHIGGVVHRWLQRIAEDEMKGWSRKRVEKMVKVFRSELAVRGVGEKELAAAAERVGRALANSLEDPRGRWLLGPQSGARNEYRISALVDGERRNLVMDRVFVDPEGRRWIVDYKTSSHEGADLEAFLDRERERYAAQLERYARVLGEGKRASLGLYFPLVCGWREWRSVTEGISDL